MKPKALNTQQHVASPSESQSAVQETNSTKIISLNHSANHPELINAVFHQQSGEYWLAHPSEFGVYVKPEHYKLLFKKAPEKKPEAEYTEQFVGTLWLWDKEAQGLRCVVEKKVRICNYDDITPSNETKPKP